MNLAVDFQQRPATVELTEPDQFNGFAVLVAGDAGPQALSAALQGAARVDDRHCYFDESALKQLIDASERRTEWRTAFDEMLAYARAKGWCDDAGRVRAHIEWARSPGPAGP